MTLLERLKRQNANWLGELPPVYEEAVAEIEALQKDAERYRWMKREVKRIPPGWDMVGWDAAIDAAMKGSAE